jgi:TRAP-type C4-dicarboxylate transport system permease small subunit
MLMLMRWFFKHLEEVVCCTALVVISISVFAQVIARYLLEIALHWTEEVAAIAMVWAVYTGASLCVRERYHIRIMVFVQNLPLKFSKSIIFAADFIWITFSLFMVKISWEYLAVMWKFPSVSPSLGINQFYPQTILVLGYALMSIRLVETYYHWFRGGAAGLPGILEEDLDK